MEAKYTKGPWVLAEMDNRKLIYRFFIKGTNGKSITKIQRDNNQPVEVDRANAILISAAPELLEALQLLLYGWDNADLQHDVTSAFNKAREAVNKATTI